MNATLALVLFSAGIAGLFYLDRDKTVRVSKAFWLPVCWLLIAGSRPVSSWFGIGSDTDGSIAATLDGSPMDAFIFEALILGGFIALFQRKKRAMAIVRASTPVLLYFIYCLISTAWSPIHGPAFKRWIKDLGDLVMVLLIVTEAQPVAALRKLFSRVGFILLPLSVMLIRYTTLGVAYDENGPLVTGLTTNKNSLGLIVFVIMVGVLWNIRALFAEKKAPNRSQRLIAQITLFLFGILLLKMAHCATAIACLILGACLMLVTSLKFIRRTPGRVHALCMVIILVGGITLMLGGESAVTGALGRRSDLGRSDIWKAAIAAADSPLFGTGFESFWNVNVEKVADQLRDYWGPTAHNLVSAHNGYIEVYLDLGWIGVCLIAAIFVSGYRHAIQCFRRNPEVGSLLLTYIATCAFYSITEVGFRVLTPSWIFLLIAVIGSNAFAAGLVVQEKRKTAAAPLGTASNAPSIPEAVPEPVWAHTHSF